MIVASQLVGKVEIQGVSQAQADLQKMDAANKQSQQSLNQLQKVTQDVGSILSNKFTAEMKNAQGGLQNLAIQADAAGLDVSKLASLQMKASESAAKLSFAQAQAAATQEKATLITNSGTASVEQIALAQARAAVAAENVAKAENAAGMAFEKVKLEAGSLSSAMNQNTEKTSFFGTAMANVQGKASSFFGGIKAGVSGLLEFGSKVGMTVMGVQAMAEMFMGAADAAGKMIGDFQQQMTKLTTTAGESQSNIKMVGNGILQMAGPTATSVKQLGDAMYWVESGGKHGKEGLDVLRIAAMGAKAEQADAADVAKVLSFALNSYAGTGLTAAQAMNTLIASVGQGSMTLSALSGAISNVLPTSAKFGISLTDITSALSTMTMQGDDASSAATHLAMMIKTLEAPSAAGAKALASVGLSSQAVSDAMRKSLPDAIEMITTALGKKFPEGSTAYNEALKNISGGSESMAAVLELSGTQLQNFKNNVTVVTGAVKAGGDSIVGWDEVQKNFNFRMDQGKAAVGALGIKIGTALLPIATQLIGFFTDTAAPALSRFSDWFVQDGIPALQRFGGAVNTFFAPVQTAIGWLNNFVGHGQAAIPIIAGIGAVIASVLVPAILAALPPLAALAIEVVAATWPFVAIAVAVGGLTAAFLHFYNTNAGFKSFIDGIGNSLSSNFMPVMHQIGDFITSTFTPVWQQLVEVWNNQMQPAFQELMTTFKQMQPELKIIAEILGGVLLYQIGVLVADIGFFAGALAGIWKGAAEMIGGYVQIFSGYVQIIAGVVSFIVDLFTGHFDKLGGDLKTILGGIGGIFTGFGNVLKGIVDGIVGGVVGGFKGMGVSVIGYINDLVHGVQDKTAQAKDAANINTLQMKINTIKHAEEMDLGTIQKLDHMRMGIADQLSKTKDETEKHSLEIKLTQVTHAEDTAVKVWESHKKMRTDSESELDKLKKSSAEKFGTIQKDIQGIFGNIGHWFTDRWHEVQGAFGGIGNWFHDRWSEAWSGTTSFFGGIGKWFTDRWHDTQNVFAGIGGWFHDRWAEAWAGVTGFFGKVGQWFSDRWNEVMATTKPFRDYMGAVFQTIWNILVALWGKVSTWFHDRFTEAYNKVVEVFGPIGKWFQDRWQDIVKIFQAVGGWFHDRFTEAWNAVVGAFQFLGKWFGDRWEDTKKVFVGVGMWFHDRFFEAWGFIVAVFTPIGKWFSDRWVDVQNIFKAVGGWFHDRFQEAWNGIVTLFAPIGKWFSDRWHDVLGGIDTFKKSVSDKFNEVKTDTSNIFKGLINGIVDQLNNGIKAVESFVNFIGQGLDTIATNLGTKGTIPVAHLARIPHYASGTDSHPGGPAVLGEEGRELVFLPRGSQVVPNNITEMILSMTGGKIPGYADGIGDIGSKILGWLSGGAKSILDNVMSSLHITAPNLPGMGNLASAMFDKVKGWALSWVESIMPKFSMGGQAVNVPGNVQSWIMQAMGITGVPGSWAGPLGVIAIHESGGNPAAINLTDSNAAAGHPSQGLFQTIPSTFMAHAIAGHLNILNPIDNTIAAIRYIQGRYGDVFHVPGILSMAAGKPYVGYANGGVIDEPISGVGLRTGTRYAFGERGSELVTPYVPSGVNLAQHGSQAWPPIHIHVHPNDLNIDSRTMARALAPALTAEIQYRTGSTL